MTVEETAQPKAEQTQAQPMQTQTATETKPVIPEEAKPVELPKAETTDPDAMPMREVDYGDGEVGKEPDFSQAPPERTARYLDGESGMDSTDVDKFVDNMIAKATKAAEEHAQKRPEMGEDEMPGRFSQRLNEWKRQGEELQAQKEYWDAVKAERERKAQEPTEVETDNQTVTEANEEGTPSFLDVINTLYSKGKDVASKLFNMRFFDVAHTPKFMRDLGLSGNKFTIRYGVIARHLGKDGEHTLPQEIWKKLPEALVHPFAITKYYADEKKQRQKGYRLYTTLKLDNGSYVVVSAEVKNEGRDNEINAINTIFGRHSLSDVHDELIYTSGKITPEQQSLLNGNNPHQYPAERELSGIAVTNGERTVTSQIPETKEVSTDKGSESLEMSKGRTEKVFADDRQDNAIINEDRNADSGVHYSKREGNRQPDEVSKGEAALRDAEVEKIFISNIKQKVIDMFEKAHLGLLKGKPQSIVKLSNRGKAFLENLSGLKFKEHIDFVLNPSDMNHIRGEHYGENEKDKGNNIPLTNEYIQNMVDVLNLPDGILYGIDKNDGRKMFFFFKYAGNGLYNLTEVCSTKRGNLTAKSFYKSKKKGINQRVMEIKRSLLPTSVTYSGESLSSAAKIPKMFETANIEDDLLTRSKTNGETDDIEYRFIGERGAAAIDKAEEATTPAGKKTATQRQAEQMQTYRNTAEQAAKSVGEEVTVVEKVEDIVDDDPKVQLKKRGAKGWYDPGTGKVVVNLSAHRDAADVAETVFHETIGHKGIEKKVRHVARWRTFAICYIPI